VSKLKELEKRLKQEPHNFGLRVQVAGLMREAGRSTEAVELYRSVALAYRDQGRTQQAIAVCKSILDIAPDDVVCNALLSTLQKDSKPSIPSLTPPPAAGPRSATMPAVGRAPTRPSQQAIGRAASPSAQPRTRPASDSVIPAPSRPAAASLQAAAQQVVRSRTKTPSAPPDPARAPLASGSEPRGQPPRTGSQPPRSSSYPPGRLPVVTIPPKSPSQPPRALTDSGTPAPAPSRPPTEPAPPTAVTGRLPLKPPTRASPPTQPPVHDHRYSSRDSISQGIPKRRSSMEETPLPPAMPHHVHDPTGRNRRVDVDDLETNPRGQRALRGTASSDDVAKELDTRPVRRLTSDEVRKLDKPPPTVEVARIPDEEIENTRTQESPPHVGHDDDETSPRDFLETSPRDFLDVDPDTEA
jgi:hypothetical protein